MCYLVSRFLDSCCILMLHGLAVSARQGKPCLRFLCGINISDGLIWPCSLYLHFQIITAFSFTFSISCCNHRISQPCHRFVPASQVVRWLHRQSENPYSLDKVLNYLLLTCHWKLASLWLCGREWKLTLYWLLKETWNANGKLLLVMYRVR